MSSDAVEAATQAQLRQALAEANIPTLMTVLAQLTGSMACFQGREVPSRVEIDGTRYISEQKRQQVRDQVLQVMGEIQRAEREVPPLPGDDELLALASGLVGEPVPAEYLGMLKHDMGLAGSDLADISPLPPAAARLSVLIVGAGISGLCAAVHLDAAGIPFQMVEKNGSVGGVWHENTYPDCGVDTPNHFYSFSFAPNDDWSGFYSKRDELHAYLDSVADKYRLKERISFNSEVTAAHYDERARNWRVAVRQPDGSERILQADVLLSAVGQLNRPHRPQLPGAEGFAGESFHSAQWRHDLELAGKDVVVIGTGASAMQFCPAIADQVRHLTIFQRSPHWIRVLPDYHRQVGEGKKLLLRSIPCYRNWYRFKLFWVFGDGIWDSIHLEPGWSHPERAVSRENDKHRQIYARALARELGNDQALMDKVIPGYPPFARRMLVDNHWCAMLRKPNVELIEGQVGELVADGVVGEDGGKRRADVLIYATGFHAGRFLWPMDIRGRNGKSLAEHWGEDARAYLGMTTPQFPNLFLLYGPNTNLAHGGSMVFHAECQARYIAGCLQDMCRAGRREIEVRPQVHDDYNRQVDAEHEQMVWAHPGVNAWYTNSAGRVVANSPWRLVDYWQMTRRAKEEDFRYDC